MKELSRVVDWPWLWHGDRLKLFLLTFFYSRWGKKKKKEKYLYICGIENKEEIKNIILGYK